MELLEVEEEESLVGRTIAAKFRVEKLLGSGSMGRVYRGRHLQLEQTVAIKVMSREFAAEKTFVARFEREAKASFAVAHPNIIRVIDFGRESSGLIYLAMEYVSGGDLASLIFRSAPLPTPRVINLMRQALAGIAAAHDAGIVHRDLKPENIMLADAIGDDGQPTNLVKVCDFGIAQLTEAHPASQRVETANRRLTQVGLIIGTPEYMAPEQAQGEKVDERSDIYAMGMVLYEMMTGTLPFVAATATEMVMKQISAQPVPPSERRSSIDPRLEQICLRALAKRPEDRYQSARQMRAALGAVIGVRESNDELPPLDSKSLAAVKKSASETRLSKGEVKPVAPTLVTSERPKPSEQPTLAPPEPPRASNAKTYGSLAVLLLAAAATGAFVMSRAPLPEPTSDEAPKVAATVAATPPPPPAATSAPAPSSAVPGSAVVTIAPSAPSASAAPLGKPIAAAAPRLPTPKPSTLTPTPASAPAPAPVVETPPPPVVAAPAPAPPASPAPVAARAIDPSTARATVTAISNVQGALRRDVEGAISRSATHFVGCYQSDLGATSAPPTGAGVLHIETDDTGTITSAHAAVPLSASGARCLERAVMRVRIPNVDTGQAQADIAISFDVH